MAVVGSAFILASLATLTLAGQSPIALVVGTVLLGLGHLCSVIAEQTWVANRVTGTGAERAFGRYTFAASSGQTVGPALLLLLCADQAIPDTSATFFAACGAAMLMAPVAFGFTGTSRSPGEMRPGAAGTGRLLRTALPDVQRLSSTIVMESVVASRPLPL
jgi:hypothetical protein